MRDIRIIVCVNKTLSIGNGNDILYKIKDDLRRFRLKTTNNVVVMGRKTYESLPKKPLDNRVNIILTSDKDYKADGCIVLTSIKDVVDLYDKEYNDRILYVIGGGKVYDEFLKTKLVTTLDITLVDDYEEGSVKFPDVFSDDDWDIIESGKCNIDENGINYSFLTYKKK